jgi:hypothetical protein
MKNKHVFSMFGACVAVTFAVGACDSEDDWGDQRFESLESCSDFTTCGTCTAANGCGWCFLSDGSGVCGDDANNCATEFAWESNFCRAPADASVSTSSADASSSGTTTNDASDGSSADAAADAADD